MEVLGIEELPIEGKKVLMRVDFNVPLDGEGNISDPTRIEAALPSIRYVLARGGILILMSHLGRPRNEPNPELSLAPVAKDLGALLRKQVIMAPDCIGEEIEKLVASLKTGEVLLLENLRFHRAETHPEEDPTFAQKLAKLADLYINDAFGTAHREHSSTYTITKYFPGKAAAGFLLEKEIRYLGEMLENPKRPFYAILGGAKISTKLGVLRRLLEKVDRLFLGGGMAYTFLKAEGREVGNSLVEEPLIPLASEILNEHREKIVLPLDVLAAEECTEEAPIKVCEVKEGIPAGFEGLDIGPKTIETYSQKLSEAKTILWNGPLGVFELDPFAKGTLAILHAITRGDAITILGGGDLVAATKKTEVGEQVTHLSTGGGATLEYLEKGSLPALSALTHPSARH
ncbi:MAG: Bifunctional PGK/TIM [Chlamydiae bacterium]|nr:Bifunctional PGK/TIM [Chlamydiota bacterium]